MVSLIVLPGNPGSRYARTRHNVARLLSEYLGWDALHWQVKWGARYTEVSLARKSVTVVKPQKLMNLTGESVSHFVRYRRIPVTEVVVVHDDVELPLGDVAWKQGGGLAGHNGLRSVADRLGSRDFQRLRIGIGRPAHGSVSSFVLGAFSASERKRLSAAFDDALDLLERNA